MTTESMSVPHVSVHVDREKEQPARTKSTAGAPPHAAGMAWFGGWLFTIGFAKLVWWKAVLGLVVWPYFLGVVLR